MFHIILEDHGAHSQQHFGEIGGEMITNVMWGSDSRMLEEQ